MPLVRIMSRANGGGLQRDLQLVADVLSRAGFAVQAVGFGNEKGVRALRIAGMRVAALWRGRPDLQLSLEHVYPQALGLARRNLLMPNPEWFRPHYRPSLPRFDALLCKTRHAGRIFDALGCNTRHVGFTSADRHDGTVVRERCFLHLAGKSPVKGTEAVVAAWRRHPEWPTLVVVQNRRNARPGQPAPNIDFRVGHVADDELRRLQNACRFHVCPSEAEGFGHSLVEAMGVGAINITTDGEPMNELVTPEHGLLVAPRRFGELGLARRFFVDADGVDQAVARALQLDATALDAMSRRARAAFDAIDGGFRQALPEAIAAFLPGG